MSIKKYVSLAGIALLTLAGCKITKIEYYAMFDGKSFNGYKGHGAWEGDPKYWRVENGEMIGEITPGNEIKVNTFLIWKGKAPQNFELTVDYRISAKGNSGVNYRSSRVDSLPFALKGYQLDLDGKDKYGLGYPRHSGQNYEERGRQFLATRGQRTVVETGQKPTFIDSTGTRAGLLKHINNDGWNTLRIVAKGNNLKHYINGILMSEVTDNDTLNRKLDGLIGVQVHVGGPMKVEYKGWRLIRLE